MRHYAEEGEEGASGEEAASGGGDFSIEDKWGKETQELIQKIPEVGGGGWFTEDDERPTTTTHQQCTSWGRPPLLIFFNGVDDFSAQSNGTCALFHTLGDL